MSDNSMARLTSPTLRLLNSVWIMESMRERKRIMESMRERKKEKKKTRNKKKKSRAGEQEKSLNSIKEKNFPNLSQSFFLSVHGMKTLKMY